MTVVHGRAQRTGGQLLVYQTVQPVSAVPARPQAVARRLTITKPRPCCSSSLPVGPVPGAAVVAYFDAQLVILEGGADRELGAQGCGAAVQDCVAS
jgi:hypothetical protein